MAKINPSDDIPLDQGYYGVIGPLNSPSSYGITQGTNNLYRVDLASGTCLFRWGSCQSLAPSRFKFYFVERLKVMNYRINVKSSETLYQVYLGLLGKLLNNSSSSISARKISLRGNEWQAMAGFAELFQPKPSGVTSCWNIELSSIESIESKLGQLINYLSNSSCHFTFAIHYRLAFSNEYMPVDLSFWGQKSTRAGLYPTDQIVVVIYEDLRHRIQPVSIENQIADATDLFFSVCEVKDEDNSKLSIQSAQLSHECGFTTPIYAKMIFHKNIKDFLRDFCFIYVSYNYGTRISALLANQEYPWDQPINPLAAEHSMKMGVSRGTYRASFDNLPEMINFLESLDETKVKALTSLPEIIVRELFLLVSEEIPEIQCHDFGTKGFALTTDPILYLWPAYKCFAELALSS